MASIEFVVRAAAESDRVMAVVPFLDGADLVELAATYEGQRGFDVVGGYNGIIPANFRFGPLVDYFIGAEGHWPGGGRIAVLGCSCGEVGCWPLYATVGTSTTTVTWRNFKQPFRAERDYSGFGPFKFDREEYEGAVRSATDALGSDESQGHPVTSTPYD